MINYTHNFIVLYAKSMETPISENQVYSIALKGILFCCNRRRSEYQK